MRPIDQRFPRLECDDQKLKNDFNAYIPLLTEHEHTHCRIATNHANQLTTDIKALGRMQCGALEKAVKAAYRKAIIDAKAAHRQFDQETLARRKKVNRGKLLLGNSYLTTPDLER